MTRPRTSQDTPPARTTVVPSDIVPRDRPFSAAGYIFAHPLFIAEAVHRHDLNAWTAAILHHIQRRIDQQAAAAIDRINTMHRHEGDHT